MKFLRNIFKGKTRLRNNSKSPKKVIKDPYAESWVSSEIPKIDINISGFIYQKGLTENSVNEFLDYGLESDMGNSGWKDKGELNFPGPFYTGITDSCGTGIIESPNNVIFDEYCMEYVMIQPRTERELLQLWNASLVEVFGSYYCDGNDHWTVQLVKEWWKNKNDIIEHLRNEELIKMNCNQDRRYKQYLNHEAKIDLRKYCFFLDNSFYPNHENLPEID